MAAPTLPSASTQPTRQAPETARTRLARYRLEPGPIPLHHQVYVHLRDAIEAGEWRVGERLPPERELAEQYGCSLITIRRALADLAREERIERTRGKGTFVMAPRIVRDLTSTLSFAEEMELRGFEPRTRLLTARREAAAEATAAALRIPIGGGVYFLERLRSAGDTPLLLEQVRLSADRFPDLPAADLEHGSLYAFLETRYGCHVERLSETIEPILLPAREARLLDQSRRLPALLVEGVAFDRQGGPVEVSRTYVPGRRSKFLVESSGRWAGGLRSMRGSGGDRAEAGAPVLATPGAVGGGPGR
jgi:GntR family transcriptional regulator, N-acetylglucosamine utilization regulator